MLWLVPFDAIQLPVPLPVDAKLDRLALTALALVWLATFLGGRATGPRLARNPLSGVVWFFVAAAFASVLLNLGVLAQAGELSLGLKKLSLVISYVVFFYIVSTTVRPTEVRPFVLLLLGLAVVMAIGTVYEYRFTTNPFFAIAAAIVPGPVSVAPEVADQEFVRASIQGPTGHGIAVCTLLGMAFPFALVRMLDSPDLRRKILYAVAAGILVTGAVATVRKTAIVIPATALIVLLLYRPLPVLRLLPLGVLLAVAIQGVAPGALSGLRYEFTDADQKNTVTDRTADYAAARPDVLNRPAIGRGYGTYDAERYRFLDNQFLGLLIETGFVGTALYVLVLLAIALMAHRLARGDPQRAGPAMAIVAATLAYLVSNALFDTLAFRHAPYVLFLIAGIAVVLYRDRFPARLAAP
jgi:O-antigen ligase